MLSAVHPLPYSPHSYFSDASTAMFIVFLMFIIPSRPPWSSGVTTTTLSHTRLKRALFTSGCTRGSTGTCQGALLDWDSIQSKLAWNVVILLGSGFALSAGAKVELSDTTISCINCRSLTIPCINAINCRSLD